MNVVLNKNHHSLEPPEHDVGGKILYKLMHAQFLFFFFFFFEGFDFFFLFFILEALLL